MSCHNFQAFLDLKTEASKTQDWAYCQGALTEGIPDQVEWVQISFSNVDTKIGIQIPYHPSLVFRCLGIPLQKGLEHKGMYDISTYIWLMFMATVGKYDSRMDGMAYG